MIAGHLFFFKGDYTLSSLNEMENSVGLISSKFTLQVCV